MAVNRKEAAKTTAEHHTTLCLLEQAACILNSSDMHSSTHRLAQRLTKAIRAEQARQLKRYDAALARVTRGVLASDANDEDPHVMSALNAGWPRDKSGAIQGAIAAGRQARNEGKPRTANPHKRDGERTLWHPWDIGWCRTRTEEDDAIGVPGGQHQPNRDQPPMPQEPGHG